ncbi:MAG: Na/Pi cotransporter family protein [Firmicutes bacterium]|nr:Na/Pi cotransporter family protein [Bacillota bacterium]
MLVVIGLLGGLALFLYGMELTSDGLQRTAAEKMKDIIQKLTTNPLMGVVVGIVVTVLLQSSTPTTVLLVGLTSAGLMTLPQSLGVTLGAGVGTTVTPLMMTFKIEQYALLAVAAGFVIMFVAKRQRTRFVGQVVLGVGFLFYGMKVMSDSVVPLRESEFFVNYLISLGDRPLIALLISTIFTAIIQSSAATVMLAISLATQGILPFEAALPIVFGANIGTCGTALLSSIGATTEAKRVAISHVVYKAIAAFLLLPLLEPFGALVRMTSDVMGRQIAYSHVLFNVAMVIIFIPFTSQMAWLMRKIVPERETEALTAQPKYLDRLALNTPSVALDLAEQEVLRLQGIVMEMVDAVGEMITARDEKLIAETLATEEIVDVLYKEVSQYLSDLSQTTMSDVDSQRIVALLHVVNDLEHIGDSIVKIARNVQKKLEGGLRFSDLGREEMLAYHVQVRDVINAAFESFRKRDAALAQQVLSREADLTQDERELRESHIARLRSGLSETRSTTSIHLDVLNGLRQMATHAGDVAHTVLDIAKGRTGVEEPLPS